MGSGFVKKPLERPTHEPLTYAGTPVITTLSHGCLIMSSFACKLPTKPHTSPRLQGQAQTQHQQIDRALKLTPGDNAVPGWAQPARRDDVPAGTRHTRAPTKGPTPGLREQTRLRSAHVGSQLFAHCTAGETAAGTATAATSPGAAFGLENKHAHRHEMYCDPAGGPRDAGRRGDGSSAPPRHHGISLHGLNVSLNYFFFFFNLQGYIYISV